MAYDYDCDAYFRSGIHLWRSVITQAIKEADGEECLITNRRESRGSIRQAAREWLTDADAPVQVPMVPLRDDDNSRSAQDASGDALSRGEEAETADKTKD